MRSSTVPRVAVLTLAATGALSAAYQAYGGWRDRRRFPPPGRLVEVGGRRVHVWPAGNAAPTVAPTVVVVPSLATSGLEWVAIKRALGPDAAVVLYDRAGVGWSDPGPRPRTAGRIADELHQLLQAAGVAPPYLLVGHSLGGLVVRLYAARHPGGQGHPRPARPAGSTDTGDAAALRDLIANDPAQAVRRPVADATLPL